GFEKDELKLGAITKSKIENPQFGHYVLAQGKHLYVAESEAPLQRQRNAKSVKDDISPAQRQAFGSADLLVHINPRAMGEDGKGLSKMAEAELGKVDDPSEKKSVDQFIKALDSV